MTLPRGMVQVEAPVLANRLITRDHYWMRLKAPGIARRAQPGQFVHVLCRAAKRGLWEKGLSPCGTVPFPPLLRRPLSLLDADPELGTIDFIYKVVGLGTRALSDIPVGVKLDTLGPLGNGFEIAPDLKTAYLVGGGVGIPPLVMLAKVIRERTEEREQRIEVRVFLGARTKDWVICVNDFKKLGVTVHVATDDGTSGYRGSVVDLLTSVIARPRRGRGDLVFKSEIASPRQGGARNDVRSTVLYICGPTPMMKAAAHVAHRWKLPARVSLEERMGCAMGCCWGCVVEVATEPVTSHARFQRVCTEGPVFPAEMIAWR